MAQGGKAFHVLAVSFPMDMQKMLGEQGDVFPPFGKRGNHDADDIEPVVQIFAKASRPYFFRKIPVGGRHDSHIHRNRFITAHSLDFPLLQGAQQFDLHLERNFPDFVKKERTAGSLEKASFPALVRSGERSFFMAEQFGFEQVFRQGGAVDRHPRPSARELS